MMNFFNINLEFNKDIVSKKIHEYILNEKKGYVCVVEGNIVSVAKRNETYREIVNSSIVNICDSTYVAMFYNLLKKEKVNHYNGGELFIKMISEKKYKHIFLGSTPVVLAALKSNLEKIDSSIEEKNFVPLPFLSVEEFNYMAIASNINSQNPDLIWVSLGAPKQEEFMQRLLPFIRKGVMVGIGAVFNFKSGIKGLERAPEIFLNLRLEWLYRIYQEPQKQWRRCKEIIKSFPELLFSEVIKAIKS